MASTLWFSCPYMIFSPWVWTSPSDSQVTSWTPILKLWNITYENRLQRLWLPSCSLFSGLSLVHAGGCELPCGVAHGARNWYQHQALLRSQWEPYGLSPTIHKNLNARNICVTELVSGSHLQWNLQMRSEPRPGSCGEAWDKGTGFNQTPIPVLQNGDSKWFSAVSHYAVG